MTSTRFSKPGVGRPLLWVVIILALLGGAAQARMEASPMPKPLLQDKGSKPAPQQAASEQAPARKTAEPSQPKAAEGATEAKPQEQQPQQTQPSGGDANRHNGQELAREANGDASAIEKGKHEEHAEFKYSKAVQWMARHTGISVRSAYWISNVANFVMLVLFFWFLLRSSLPKMFRERTARIQRGIREAEAVSADANRRLGEIESRLAKLDSDVAEIRAAAEHDAAQEEARIRAAAEEDARKVVEAAEAEIAAITRNAQRELKGYAASLAVDLAAKQIHIDNRADQALVREFSNQLGKDGR